ncbi:MAG: Mth938-like domain-containing protein [Rubrivivax sp.]
MKFQPDQLPGVNVISRIEAGRVWVNGAAQAASLIVPSRGPVAAWEAESFEGLQASHFDRLAEWQPEVVLFGSGGRLRFPSAALLRGLIGRRIGVETMDTAAAARTYNVLASEGRVVVAALLLEVRSA